jgi:hypothetical protein
MAGSPTQFVSMTGRELLTTGDIEMKSLKIVLGVVFSIAMLSACSGGGGGSSSANNSGPSSMKLSGTAATGNPIANAAVSLVDKTGKTASGTTGANGSFTIDTTGLTPPFMLKVASSSSSTYYSISADANATTTINITPLTDMIIRTWYSVQGTSVDTAFSNPVTNPPPTPTEVKVISTVVQNVAEGWLQQAGVDTANFSLISTPFNANGSGVDGVINMTTVNPATGSIIISSGTVTQNSILTVSGGTVDVSSTSTTTIGTSGAIITSTVVPTTTAQSSALDGISSSISAFITTVNQKGSSLQAADLAPYVDPSYKNDGMTGPQWEAQVAKDLAGTTLSFSGLQINSLDTTNNVADVSFQISRTQGGVTEKDTLQAYFKLINNSWLISGNGHIASAYAMTWAWAQNGYSQSIRFEVDDPQVNNVQSVTVSGPMLSSAATATVSMVCDSNGMGGLPTCGTSYGNGTMRAFQLELPGWPAIPSTYTFTLTDSSSVVHTYTWTVNAAYGYNASGPLIADYPAMTLTSPSNLTFSNILSGGTVHGSVFIPIWVTGHGDAPHFNYEAPGGTNNNVSNQSVSGTWDSGVAIPGQVNNFTIVVPAATVNSTSTCTGGSGTCYNITFQGNTGDVQGGWFGEDACYGGGGGEAQSCTNNGIAY